ncbi:MAG: hypothetical protein M3O20_02080 [Acidobacteriota bacterium]|nr:hypothetical protein [Acidobacteriota bacterium]
MKPLRVLWLACAASAQTPELNQVTTCQSFHKSGNAIADAHDSYNAFTCLANQWARQHTDQISSPQDSERLAKAIEAFEKFHRLAKDAGLLKKKGKH